MVKLLCDICGDEINENAQILERGTLRVTLVGGNAVIDDKPFDVHLKCGRAMLKLMRESLKTEQT